MIQAFFSFQHKTKKNMLDFIKNIFKPAEKAYKDLNTNDFKQAIKNKAIIVDVRTPNEYSSGKIAKAKNINVASFDFMKEAKSLDQNQEILVYCRSGARSARAAKMLSKIGFTKVSNLKGGVMAWQKHGEKLV